MGRIGSVRLQKNPTRLHGTNFCTSSARFEPSFVKQLNGPECTQIVRNAPKCQFWVQWGGSGVFVVKNSVATSRHELLHQFGPFCTEFRKATKRSRMQPNSLKRTRTWVLDPMVWIGCLRCEKFQRVFVAWSFALIAPVRPDLHRISCSNEIFPNAPKHYEILQNISLGCNGMDRLRLLRKNSDATSLHELLH